jgi:cyclase
MRLLVIAAMFAATGVVGAKAQQKPAETTDLDVVQVQPDLYMLAGAGGNIAVQIGPDGVIIVDTGSANKTDAVLAEIRKLTSRPIRYIINTNADADHVGGNEKVSAAGQPVHQPGALFGNLSPLAGSRAPILAEEHVQTRMISGDKTQTPYPTGAWPTITYSSAVLENQRSMYINGQAVQVFYQPAAHSDGDSIVFFRRSDVIVAGDVMDMNHFPVIDIKRGGSIQGIIDSLNRIILLAVPPTPMTWQEGGTAIIPGHGRVALPADVVLYRDMITIIRDRVQDLASKGRTLAQIQQANPTQGYRSRYGSDSGAWTTAMFLEAVHSSLTPRKAASR